MKMKQNRSIGDSPALREARGSIHKLAALPPCDRPNNANLDIFRLIIDAVKHLEIFLHDEAPDCWTLAQSRISLGKETQLFGLRNYAFSQRRAAWGLFVAIEPTINLRSSMNVSRKITLKSIRSIELELHLLSIPSVALDRPFQWLHPTQPKVAGRFRHIRFALLNQFPVPQKPSTISAPIRAVHPALNCPTELQFR